ncbi:MFS transporter [Marinitenerispora sediminis]|uniref:MFS transporter n=1 Tax=Marinitenerispora sediminis TaxID=1931232 RepID=A0A368T8T4_9ACTN|nr:MFS transporter [Marinitenerispora sediminis]RCV55442.1 MFS transporter [Marinitenerispora sediminis]RCV60788.1 MFS transporter [Marinitenerispora sediminis]RCV61739.1 MFS transporter [Marinitenerispora sediminis]
MSFHRDLRDVLRGPRFRRLFGTRVVSQCADGMYQAGLAGYVFFSPEQHTTAGAVAGAFAALLLPFSVVGPFAGVFIDRWSRRQVLVVAAAVKTALAVLTAALVATGADGPAFLLAALCLLSVNRFFLAALSAALPHVVPADRLMMANAVTPTCGTFASFLGAGLGAGLRLLGGEGPGGTALILLAAGGGFTAAALTALTLRRTELGPDLTGEPPEVRAAVRRVLAGLADGLRHVWRHRTAAGALATIGGHRFLYGVSTIMTLLLYNNTFTSGGVAGFAGFSVTLATSAAGYALGAVATPWATARIRTETWIAGLLGSGCVALLLFGLPFSPALFPVAGFALGVVSQGVKVSVDTLVQRHVDDAYRGRVFSCYDMLFNAAFVAAAGVAALVVPPSGVSAAAVLGMAAGYAALSAAWLPRARRALRPAAPAT